MDATWRLLVIKSGGNQRYIFGTNKRRLNVGASHLLTRLPDWVDRAITPRTSRVHCLVSVSGVAELLVKDAETAKAIIREVTTQALEDAPGLEVWGWFEQEPTEGSLATRLNTALRRMEQRRSMLPSPLARNPMTPFSQRCPVTSEPAVSGPGGAAHFGDEDPVWLSAQATAQFGAAKAGRNRMVKDLDPDGAAGRAHALVEEGNFDKSVDDNGWIAVVHADGNGFGQMLAKLEVAANTPDDYPDLLKKVSKELDSVAHQALAEAVDRLLRQGADGGWLLPLIVGGDDLTAVVNAQWAREFVTAYLTEFEEASRNSPVLAKVAEKVLNAENLTACAGIAIVKTTMPFSQAYDLAEELCHSAKSVKSTLPDTPVSAFDIQVIHEAAGRNLSDIRICAGGAPGVQTPFEPYITSRPDSVPPGDLEWIGDHHADRLNNAISSLAADQFNGKVRHRVRTALIQPPEVYERTRKVMLAKAYLSADPDERSWAPELEEWLKHHGGARGLAAIDVATVEKA